MTTTNTDFDGDLFASAVDAEAVTGETQPTETLYGKDDTGDGDSRERQPTERKERRHSAANLITLVWGGAGTLLVRSETDVPVGRVLQFQAPLAGQKIDELIAHTWLDSVLQPFVKQAEKIEGLGAVIMFPLLVGAYERNPAIGEFVEPLLREVIHETLIDLAPVIRKRKSAERRAAASMSDINDVLGIEPGADPVQAILATIFAPIGGTADGETPASE